MLICFALAAILFNIVSVSLWLNAYWNTNTHEQAVAKFENYFPGKYSAGTFYTLSMSATIFSIVLLTRHKVAQNHITFTSLIIIQAAFLLLFTWQLL